MPSSYRCFLLIPTEQVVISLRRFAFPRDGAPRCGLDLPRYPDAEKFVREVHDIEAEIGRELGTLEGDLDGDSTGKGVAADDPRWPTSCPCGYVFTSTDGRQEWRTRLYRRSDNDELTTISKAPVGALYDSGTFRGVPGYDRNGPGSLVCKTPAGEWLIDGPANNGPGWTRVGEPPDIVVTPSIGIGNRMHGWLGGWHGQGNMPGWLCIDSP